MAWSRTIIGDVGDLEPPGAVDLVGLEVDPEPSRSSREGDGPLVGLTRLVGGDGRGRPWRRRRGGAWSFKHRAPREQPDVAEADSQFFLMTSTSPHSSSEGRKISGTTIKILRLLGGLMFQMHSTLAG